MRSCVRFSFLALLVGVLVAVAAPAGAEAAVGIERFVATNCKAEFPECAEEPGPTTAFGPTKIPKEPSKEEAEAQGFTQAAGHVPFGVTDFKLTTVKTGVPLASTEAPTGIVKHIRTDVAPGLATSPAAVPQCTGAQFGETEAVPGSGFFAAPTCPAVGPTSTVVGSQDATVYAGPEAGDVPLSGTVYNLVQKEGLASEFGVALSIPQPLSAGALKAGFKEAEEKGAVPGVGGFPTLEQQAGLEAGEYFAHTLIEGSVEWGQETKGTNQGDYHDYFEINVSTALPLIRSRLSFFGTSGNGAFITNGTSCPGHNTTRLATTGTEETTVTRDFTTPIGLSNCGAVPFLPTFALTPETTMSDAPVGFTTTVGIPRHTAANEIDSSQLKTATITLPEGMTLNPSAAATLAACTPAQARIHSSTKGTDCPAASEIGTVDLEVPTLPEVPAVPTSPLKGKIFLGGPESGPITGPPYDIYLDAESQRYGVSVRIKGETIPNETTGRVTTVFSENPEQPFTAAILHFKGGDLAPIANPLACGTATSDRSFAPYTGTPAFSPALTPFVVDSNGTGGACAKPIAFAPTQATASSNPHAGGHTNYTFNLERPSGQQYLSEVKTTLPGGLVGTIPAAKQCPEADANAGTCSAESLIGSASAVAGAGPKPFTFLGGRVYLTGPYHGAPFGLSIVVPAVAGPFNLGNVVTRAKLDIDPTTARVTASSVLPRVYKGVALRLRNVSVSINKANFLYNPTACNPMATNSTLVGFVPGSSDASTATLSTPFQLDNCNALKFKPGFKASSSANTSKANGASLTTTVTPAAGQANIKSVKVSLPKALPSRLTTLQKACTEAQFAKDPMKCPSGSFVGGATVVTPTLPVKMTGPAILVSHGGAAFPDLDLVVQGSGVRVILVGNTDIKNGITTTTFASTPDVPVTGVTVNLPIGSHSALAANGNLCANKLVMPTTITGQNGVVVKQNTVVSVAGCGVRVVGHKVAGNNAILTVQTFGAGRISGKGKSLAATFRKLSKAQKKATLKVPLSQGGRGRHRPFKVKVRVGFVPKAKGGKSSASFVTVSFR
jgi:hypothetical protein